MPERQDPNAPQQIFVQVRNKKSRLQFLQP